MSLSTLALPDDGGDLDKAQWRPIKSAGVPGLEFLIRPLSSDRARDLRRDLNARVLGGLRNVLLATPTAVETYINICVFLDAVEGWRGLTLPVDENGAPDLSFKSEKEAPFEYSPELARDLFLVDADDGLLTFFDHQAKGHRKLRTPDGKKPRYVTSVMFNLLYGDLQGFFDGLDEITDLVSDDGEEDRDSEDEEDTEKNASSPGSNGEPGDASETDALS